MNQISNRTFDEIQIGDSATLIRTATLQDIALFAATSGDINPAHMDADFAAGERFGQVVVHGMWTASLISALLGNELPGPGTVYLGQDMRFKRPVRPGDIITARISVREKREDKKVVVFDCLCSDADGRPVLTGSAEVIAPTVKHELNRTEMPEVQVNRHRIFDLGMKRAYLLPPLRAAVVQPTSERSITAAVEASDDRLFVPVLVGPRGRIEAAAKSAGVSIDGIELIDVPHSHAAALKAAQMAGAGEVDALMKGSLHTDELLSAVVARDNGLRTDRWLSHVFLFDVPAYDKLLIVTDGAINIAPTLEQKRDIAQNAIDLARTLGVREPKVAVLAAVETVNPKMASTLDAAALTVMAARGQIEHGLVDGPLAFDNAIDMDAVREKGIESRVAGQADILLAPDLEAGNIAAKQLMYFARADSAGLVLGAKVPIILTSRADSVRTRLASIALARIVAHTKTAEGAA
ncbi:bifunctional enoyl-CoA hydratase/phosphate acetyltransferase [Lysobacter pythonis]|uniref:Bifunctional enoyl-CoA hydratase/phosphate acetyltransferase n=1 Tax=Solilutibacter pythonis TaxID=2483112 RepID=A0A3M2HTG0_9GAMM|nr:bifunctional enoyl-CoA hydratase/phosphate acetyltransferase [Lysobacter pythonis]RMH90960.1 bifunctional enoyl-CoA hydratase/phosphate acetyltransferase [Lysobacter pythonis]